jgi:hypothetical protein
MHGARAFRKRVIARFKRHCNEHGSHQAASEKARATARLREREARLGGGYAGPSGA